MKEQRHTIFTFQAISNVRETFLGVSNEVTLKLVKKKPNTSLQEHNRSKKRRRMSKKVCADKDGPKVVYKKKTSILKIASKPSLLWYKIILDYLSQAIRRRKDACIFLFLNLHYKRNTRRRVGVFVVSNRRLPDQKIPKEEEDNSKRTLEYHFEKSKRPRLKTSEYVYRLPNKSSRTTIWSKRNFQTNERPSKLEEVLTGRNCPETDLKDTKKTSSTP